MKIRIALAALVGLAVATSAWGQEPNAADDVQQGHHLATLICSNCHLAAPDQPYEPILRPPAPSFESIAQRNTLDAAALQSFLATAHRDVSNPNGMPNPQLMDFQIRQVTAYLLSLRKSPAGR